MLQWSLNHVLPVPAVPEPLVLSFASKLPLPVIVLSFNVFPTAPEAASIPL